MSKIRPAKSSLLENIVHYGDLAYNPEFSATDRRQNEVNLSDLLENAATSKLMPALTTLVQPGRVQPWLRPHLIQVLSLLPLRSRGVRQTIEFVLSVHPTTGHDSLNSTSSTAKSRGPSISLEALNSASRLISSPPSTFSPEKWFAAIAPQLLGLLDGEGGLEMIKVAAFIVGFGILGRKECGAPGAPGWKAFAQPFLGRIDPTLANHSAFSVMDDPQLVDSTSFLRPRNILCTAMELAEALRRLASLLSSHPNPGLSKRLLTPILLPLWALASWNEDDGAQEDWRAPAQYLLQILLQLSDSSKLLIITRNLLFQGNHNNSLVCWSYVLAPKGGIQVERWSGVDEILEFHSFPDLMTIDRKIDSFISILQPVKGPDEVSTIFLSLSRSWLLNEDSKTPVVKVSAVDDDQFTDYEQKIIDMKILQKMIDSFPDRLVGDSAQVLDLANKVLSAFVRSGENLDTDDTVAVALSLLNMVFTSPAFGIGSVDEATMNEIRISLQKLGSEIGTETSSTSRNLLMILQYSDTHSVPAIRPLINSREDEDRKSYKLALSYLKAADSPTPVRAQGLDLYASLISSSSPILDIPATIVLLSTLLQDEEEYIYLRAIKAFVLLSIKHPRAVFQSLIEQYIDLNEEASLDARLRTGEVLLQVIEKAGETFTGDTANEVVQRLVWVASRRGYRPKTEARQNKAAVASKKKNDAAENAWDGTVPQLEDSAEKTADDVILEGIVQGWEGKRGVEDVRIRASALSILGSAIEINVAGLGSSAVSSGVDLSINTLAMEPENEKIILRRAAILLVMSLVRALDKAREEGKKLGFGFAGQSLEDVVRILTYVEETDADGLVRQHAKDVIEGLNDWQVKGLLASGVGGQPVIEKLAGLSVNPEINPTRPRIEEIE